VPAGSDRPAGVVVRNASTGETVRTYFGAASDVFLTSLVPRAPGRNVIRIEWRESKEGSLRYVIAEIPR